MQRFGLRPGAQILEPSMGVGHFFGLMPDELLTGSRRTGVELDSVTARIAKCLYPDSTLFAKGFEDTPLPDNFFDAVIGNIPFGNYAVHDPAYRRTPALTRTIHDYFLAKSLDKVRPGGVLALITSRYTMDKQDATIRRHLAERADLIARDPASQHHIQSECGNGSHDRHSVSAKAGAPARTREPTLARPQTENPGRIWPQSKHPTGRFPSTSISFGIPR